MKLLINPLKHVGLNEVDVINAIFQFVNIIWKEKYINGVFFNGNTKEKNHKS